MTLDGPPVPLSGWDDLKQLADGADVGSALPATVPPPGGLTLRQLSLPIPLGPGPLTSPAASFDVGLDASWDLLPNGILTLSDLGPTPPTSRWVCRSRRST
jgi:hypothetical protein